MMVGGEGARVGMSCGLGRGLLEAELLGGEVVIMGVLVVLLREVLRAMDEVRGTGEVVLEGLQSLTEEGNQAGAGGLVIMGQRDAVGTVVMKAMTEREGVRAGRSHE